MADSSSKLEFLARFERYDRSLAPPISMQAFYTVAARELSREHRLFNSDSYSDLTIVAGNARFNVHQAILTLCTSFFENATKEENGFSESKDKVVTIRDHSAHAIWRVLKYCYTGDYSDASNDRTLGEGLDPATVVRACRVC